MNTLLTRWSIAVLGLLLTGPAIAQTLPAATGRLKPTRSPHSAAAEHPRNVQTRVDRPNAL